MEKGHNHCLTGKFSAKCLHYMVKKIKICFRLHKELKVEVQFNMIFTL